MLPRGNTLVKVITSLNEAADQLANKDKDAALQLEKKALKKLKHVDASPLLNSLIALHHCRMGYLICDATSHPVKLNNQQALYFVKEAITHFDQAIELIKKLPEKTLTHDQIIFFAQVNYFKAMALFCVLHLGAAGLAALQSATDLIAKNIDEDKLTLEDKAYLISYCTGAIGSLALSINDPKTIQEMEAEIHALEKKLNIYTPPDAPHIEVNNQIRIRNEAETARMLFACALVKIPGLDQSTLRHTSIFKRSLPLPKEDTSALTYKLSR